MKNSLHHHVVQIWLVIAAVFFAGLIVNAQALWAIPNTEVAVQIKATGIKSELSQGSEVWIAAFGDKLAEQSVPAGWERKGNRVVSYLNQPALWDGTMAAKNTRIEFVKHPWSGIAQVTIGGITRTYDLYSEKETTITVMPEEFLKQADFSKNGLWYLASFTILLFLFFAAWRLVAVRLSFSVDDGVFQSRNIGYVSRLDHLRFAAASMVVAYHYFHDYVGLHYYTPNPFLSLVDEGHTGVALFMVLSGMVFGLIGYKRKINYFGFLFNRVARIYPLYLFALFLAHSSHRMDFTNLDMAFFVFPFFNQIKLAMIPLLGQLWTIGVEFQFYLIFPFLNLFIFRYGLRYAVGFLFLSLFFKEFYFMIDGTVRDVAYWTILGRIDQFIIGIVAAHLYKERAQHFKNPAFLLCSVVLLIGGIQWFNNHGGYGQAPNAHFWVLWPLIEAGLWGFLSLSYIACRWNFPAWYDQAFSRLGAMSFSIYVMHYFVVPLVERKVGLLYLTAYPNLNIVLTCLVLVLPGVLFLSAFTYELIEKPFFQFRKKYVVE